MEIVNKLKENIGFRYDLYKKRREWNKLYVWRGAGLYDRRSGECVGINIEKLAEEERLEREEYEETMRDILKGSALGGCAGGLVGTIAGFTTSENNSLELGAIGTTLGAFLGIFLDTKEISRQINS